ncbi:hypothetical protein ACFLS9_03445 [Bacteroidota bacterium]
MKTKSILSVYLIMIAFCFIISTIKAQSSLSDFKVLGQKFDLAGTHLQEPQYYLMESTLITYALDGTRIGNDIFRLYLKCIPNEIAGTKGDQYTCVKFTFQRGDSTIVEIPALKNWSYMFKDLPSGIDAEGQVFGIDHSKFENLVDSDGKVIPPDKSYLIYNAFIDFHGFCNVFAERTNGGKGIQDLNTIGQKIVHAAAFSEPPVNLGSNIKKGSYFKNGKITLEFKGISLVNNKQCALLEYDSGESSFNMIMEPMPNMEIHTIGSSHYWGDIYKDLVSNWVQKVILNEIVVAETTLPVPPNKINSIAERSVIVRNVSEDKFKENVSL